MCASPRSPHRRKLLTFMEGDEIDSYVFVSKNAKGKSRKRAHPLGRGGSAEVYLVAQSLHRQHQVLRAMKLFVYRDDIWKRAKPDLTTPISKDEFLREVINFSKLNHEGLVKVIDAGIHVYQDLQLKKFREIPYIVTDYIEGFTLQDLLQDTPSKSHPHTDSIFSTRRTLQENPIRILDLLIRIARAIEFMHARQFYHCDIAPKNIFLNQNDYYNPVLGDLGLGVCFADKRPNARFRVAGTSRYMPAPIAKHYGKRIGWSEFVAFQPYWDIYSFSKSALEVCEIVQDTASVRWMKPLTESLQLAEGNQRYHSISDLLRQLEWLRPVDRVPELNDGLSAQYKRIIPVNSPALSRRLKRVATHPAMVRLERLNQLTLARGVFVGARHSRYEHALGSLEAMRRYLVALVDGPDFLTRLNPSSIETALLSALLSSSTKLPFHHVASDIKGVLPKDSALMPPGEIFDAVFKSIKDRRGLTLTDVISDLFPNVELAKLRAIILGDKELFTSHQERLIHSMLNSSLDVRVADFIRRDSTHVGLSGFTFDLEELLGELTVANERLALRGRGVGVAEQLIVMRYWLFNRVYWNAPNRSLISMLRLALHELSAKHDFLKNFRKSILFLSDDEAVGFCLTYAKKKRMSDVVELLELIMGPEQQLYRPFVQVSHSELTELSGVWQKACGMNFTQLNDLASRIGRKLAERSPQSSVPKSQLVLVDVPPDETSAKTKLGQDIIILGHDDEHPKTLASVSDLVAGIHHGFNKQLRKLRIFINPIFWSKLTQEDRKRMRSTAIEFLRTYD